MSKRTASVAALAAISDTNKAEEEDLFKPQILEAKNSPSQSKKAVAIVRPQPQVIGAKNNNENIDREARFSLYDFTSDSESEEPASSAHTKKEAVKKEAKTGPKFNRNKIFASTSPKLKKEPQQNSSVEPNKSTENSGDFNNNVFNQDYTELEQSGKVMATDLPTSDPNNAGQLWNDNGTVKISAG